MARYNTAASTPRAAKSPVKSVKVAGATTYEGHQGYQSDGQGELFRLGVNLFAGGEDTFYEKGIDRDARFSGLVQSLAVSDPEFIAGFLPWLRGEGNIRTASQLGAVDAVHSRLVDKTSDASGDQALGYNRKLLTSVAKRLDEVGEQFAIWDSRHGRPFPSALKRAAGDSFDNLLNPYSWMKYDTPSHAWRVGDVVELAHLKPSSPEQAELFRIAIASRHGNSYEINSELTPMLWHNQNLRKNALEDPKVLLVPEFLKSAGLTWEDALSLAGNKVKKADLWNALILGGSMGYMAILRNLRNFQEAGISQEATERVNAILSDPAQVAKSRQFPFRFWSAYKNAQGSQWGHALETGLSHCVSNIPELPGTTAILIDTSASMGSMMSGRSQIAMVEAAALYGASVAAKNAGRVTLHVYASSHREVAVARGTSVLRLTEQIYNGVGNVGHGTETVAAVTAVINKHNPDRIMVFTDQQSFAGADRNYYGYGGSIEHVIPAGTHAYAWNLGGYATVDMPSGESHRHQLAGLSDGTFKMIPLLERGRDARWPWLAK
jgi:hypothetical protein